MYQLSLPLCSASIFAIFAVSPALDAAPFKWRTVVDNGYAAPRSSAARFFSYNQPSVSQTGLVVFRARAKLTKSGGEPIRGIFVRNMSLQASRASIGMIAGNVDPFQLVPPPNNIATPGPAAFNEFPSFPRISATGYTVAFRGQSQPSWQDPILGKLGGTSGVYSNPAGDLGTVVRNIEAVAGFTQYLVPPEAVMNAEPARFEQFPGAPAVEGNGTVAFKGNYADGSSSRTGIFFRSSISSSEPVHAVAWSGLPIPDGQGEPTAGVFGSTAPPSVARGQVVFTGFDNEENPTAGGIMIGKLEQSPEVRAMLSIGDEVPEVADARFTRFGESLSFDGRYISFWGAWGTETIDGQRDPAGWTDIVVTCPNEGNNARRQACIDQDDNGVPGDGIYTLSVPTHQGIFVHDKDRRVTRLIARTGDGDGFRDFLFWNFSGAPPGTGSGHGGDSGDEGADREPPRWRSSAFSAVSHGEDRDRYRPIKVAFKAQKVEVDGIYLRINRGAISTLAETGMSGRLFDSRNPKADLPITSLGLERDGFRGNLLAISASMADADSSWAGIYFTDLLGR